MKRDERGLSLSVEAVLIVPAVVLIALFMIMWARVALANTAVEGAAGAAARAAAMARTAGEAKSEGAAVAAANLASTRLRGCEPPQTSVEVGAFSAPPGQPGTVRATVTCTVSAADLIGLPVGSFTLSKSATAPLDRYRGR